MHPELDTKIKDYEKGTDVAHIPEELYKKVNWFDNLENIVEDKNIKRMYMIKKVKKEGNNANINLILVRPKDFVEVLTKSSYTGEYRKYFTTLAEIRRSYQETYLPWIIFFNFITIKIDLNYENK